MGVEICRIDLFHSRLSLYIFILFYVERDYNYYFVKPSTTTAYLSKDRCGVGHAPLLLLRKIEKFASPRLTVRPHIYSLAFLYTNETKLTCYCCHAKMIVDCHNSENLALIYIRYLVYFCQVPYNLLPNHR